MLASSCRGADVEKPQSRTVTVENGVIRATAYYYQWQIDHMDGKCNGHCYYCHLENMTLKTRIWRWLVG